MGVFIIKVGGGDVMDCFILPLMTDSTVKIIAGLLCLVLVGIIIMRRKGKKKADEEDF
jgi:hypothetical protein